MDFYLFQYMYVCVVVNVLLSLEETYADVMPVRLNEDSVTAYVWVLPHFEITRLW